MYVAARKLTAMGHVYEVREQVPVSALPPRTLRNLLTLRRLAEVEAGSVEEMRDPPMLAIPPQPTGDPTARKRGRPKGSRNKAALVAAEA